MAKLKKLDLIKGSKKLPPILLNLANVTDFCLIGCYKFNLLGFYNWIAVINIDYANNIKIILQFLINT
jgi:hypothetical protein